MSCLKDASSDGDARKTKGEYEGMTPVRFPFYLFAQRVAWGEAKPEEVAYMSAIASLAEREGDWDMYMNDYMA